jgi:hypothetical protein
LVDATTPTIDYVSPTEDNETNKSQDWAFVNVSVTESNFANITFRLYFSNNTEVNITTYETEIFEINWTSLSDEKYTYNVTVVDIVNHENSTENRNITLDTVSPNITFVSPTTATGIFSQDYIEANVTADDSGTGILNLTIYLYNQTSLVQSNTTTDTNLFVNFTSLPDDIYSLNSTTFDFASNSNSTETRTITLDTSNPLIDFVSPTEDNNTFVSRNWVFVNVSVTELNEDTITFEIYNDTLVNSTSSTSGQREINWTNLADGEYYYNVTINDSAGRENNTETRLITLDTTKPFVDINYPENTTYTDFRDVTELNFTVSDTNLINCWYSLDGGVTNSSPTDCSSNFSSLSVVEQETDSWLNNWTVYANDSADNENSSVVFFTTETPFKDFNVTLNTNITLDFIPDNNTHQGVGAINQTSGAFLMNNNLTSNSDIVVKINETNDNITIKIGNSSNYSLAISMNTTYQTVYFNLTVNSTDSLWIWADYNNPLQPWFPEIEIKAVFNVIFGLIIPRGKLW